jgi:hypothetical protein
MGYDHHLVERVTQLLQRKDIRFEEKKMFGGIAFMVQHKVCVAVIKESLLVKLDPAEREAALKKKGCREMDFSRRTAKGAVFVDPEGTDRDKDLGYWVDVALAYNKKAAGF